MLYIGWKTRNTGQVPVVSSGKADLCYARKRKYVLKIFWVVTRRHFLVYDQRFGIIYLSHLQDLRKKGKK
jgi:hypothetical protein